MITVTQTETAPVRRKRLHRAWLVAGVAFVATIGAAGFRATPGVFITPLHDEFGWSTGTIASAVSVNLILFGLTAPFAAALMERFGMRRVVSGALIAPAAIVIGCLFEWQLSFRQTPKLNVPVIAYVPGFSAVALTTNDMLVSENSFASRFSPRPPSNLAFAIVTRSSLMSWCRFR